MFLTDSDAKILYSELHCITPFWYFMKDLLFKDSFSGIIIFVNEINNLTDSFQEMDENEQITIHQFLVKLGRHIDIEDTNALIFFFQPPKKEKISNIYQLFRYLEDSGMISVETGLSVLIPAFKSIKREDFVLKCQIYERK